MGIFVLNIIDFSIRRLKGPDAYDTTMVFRSVNKADLHFHRQQYAHKNPLGHLTLQEHWRESHDILLAFNTVELVGSG